MIFFSVKKNMQELSRLHKNKKTNIHCIYFSKTSLISTCKLSLLVYMILDFIQVNFQRKLINEYKANYY